MEIIKKLAGLKVPLKHGWNMLLLSLFILVCSLLLLVSFLGFIDIIKAFDEPTTGVNTFISFMVLALTLAILCYTAASVEKNKELFSKTGRAFSISTILFFVGFISIKGVNNQIINYSGDFIKLISFFAVIAAIFYAIISFVSGLFMLLTIQTGLWDKFVQDIKNARAWFNNLKNKRIIIIILMVIYLLIIIFLQFKYYLPN